jgi:hypothetical protein
MKIIFYFNYMPMGKSDIVSYTLVCNCVIMTADVITASLQFYIK